MMHGLWLSFLIWVPVLGGMLLLLPGWKTPILRRSFALAISLVTFALSLWVWFHFEDRTAAMQFVERVPWIPLLNANYHLGIDGISLPFLVLTTFSTVLVVLAGWRIVDYRQAGYFAAFLIMEGFMNGVFSALDGLLFYFFWEAMLIPMFLIIGIWGGPRRIYASFKFFLYTFLGSVLMLVALIYLGQRVGSYDLLAFQRAPLGLGVQIWIFIAFLVAFAVKVPMWPVHTWLPDAHVEAPTGGSVILAAIMLKMGAYGFLRLSLPIAPDASRYFAGLMVALSLVAILYIGFVALVQTDMKKLIAYSSIVHMGFVTLGFFALYFMMGALTTEAARMGVEGGIFQMISHGLVSAALFLSVGVLYDRLHSREIGTYGGVAKVMPAFGALFVFFAMANVGLPGTSGFVGEFQVILSTWQANPWWSLGAALNLVIGAGFTLWLMKRVVFGPVQNEAVSGLPGLDWRERLVLFSLAVPVLVLGLWPAPVIDVMRSSVAHLVRQALATKIG